jgi:S-formylglutathione hydrolase FrmB
MRIRPALVLFVSLIAVACVPAIRAQGRAECAAFSSTILNRPVRYCAYLPASFDTDKSKHYPVLYYFHGLGDNEQSLLNTGGWDLIEDLRRTGKIGEFVILAPGAGHTFFLDSADGKIRYEDFLLREFMPQMEKKYRVDSAAAHRGITGISMGGFGALRLAFKYPQQFAAVTAQMPALIAEIPANFAMGGPGSPASFMGDIFGNPFNRAYFERNNVFYFARTTPAAQLKRLRIYFDVGSNDDYGFEQGGQKLHQLLDSRGVPNEFHIYPGSHTPQYVMRHFGEVMQFQWKAIAK